MKRVLQIALGLVYLVAVFISLIVLIKPGASIFYKKYRIEPQSLSQDGNAYDYQYEINYHFFNPNSILILEDQNILGFASPDYTKTSGSGTFALKNFGGNHITVLFAPTDFSDPVTNGHTYSIYIRPYIISSQMGRIAFLLLMLGLIAFFGSILIDTQKRRLLFGSLFGVVRLWCNQCDAVAGNLKFVLKSSTVLIKYSIVNTILIAYFYVFMEWIFFVTKPSFMELLSLGEKVKIFFITGFASTLLSLLMLPVIFLLDIILTQKFPSFRKYAYQFPATFLATSLCLILIDNFTYITFNYGIVNTTTIVRVLYALLFVGIFIYILRKMVAAIKPSFVQRSFRTQTYAATILFTVSLILIVFSFNPDNRTFAHVEQNASGNIKPNIIIIGSDGLNANNMSVYGYDRDTTPFIKELAKISLFSENNFTNAANSTGSDTALLTGKLPFTTHVLFPPDTLKGEDMYQHLPGLLKIRGYLTVSLGVPYYVDANTINFQNAFDAVNCQENTNDASSSYLSGYGYADEIYLLTTIEERIGDRLKHIFFIKEMQNPYAIITQVDSDGMTDQRRMECLRTYLDEARQNGQPLFAHIHLIGTHGARFAPDIRIFSKDKIQNNGWMTDFYDDAILNFDNEVQLLVQYLKEHEQYDNTILILYTDHGQKYITTTKVPLIIHFPVDQYTGTVTESTQIIDIAPTILDYMSIQKPVWMEGSSLLRQLDSNRLIIAGISSQKEQINSGVFAISKDALKPPFYQFSQLSVIQCQKWYMFNLTDSTVSEGMVENYVNPCSTAKLDSPEEIREKVGMMLIHLGYTLPDDW